MLKFFNAPRAFVYIFRTVSVDVGADQLENGCKSCNFLAGNLEVLAERNCDVLLLRSKKFGNFKSRACEWRSTGKKFPPPILVPL